MAARAHARSMGMFVAAGVLLAPSLAQSGCGGDGKPKPPPPTYLKRVFAPVLDEVRRSAGGQARLAQLTLAPTRIDFRQRTRRGLQGFAAGPPFRSVERIAIGVSRKELQSERPFGLSAVDSGVPQRLARAILVREKGRGFSLVQMLLERPPHAALAWTVEGKVDGRRVRYVAAADGRRLHEPKSQLGNQPRKRGRSTAAPTGRSEKKAHARRESPQLKAQRKKELRQIKAIQRCIDAAKSDQKKIMKCNKTVLGK